MYRRPYYWRRRIGPRFWGWGWGRRTWGCGCLPLFLVIGLLALGVILMFSGFRI